MRLMRFLSWSVGMLSCLSLTARAEETAEPAHYYTLTISLAPAFCQLHPERRDMRQCQEGYSVIVHGLAPEREDGKAAENCSKAPPALSPVQERVLERLMPDDPLRVNEWQRHGSCTGMSAQDYFRMLMAYANKLKLPEQLNKEGSDQVLDRNLLVTEIMRMNNGLPTKGIYLRCTRKNDEMPMLTEVRVCYKPNGQFTECINSFRPNCPTTITIRAVP